jgi:6-phosphogluconate dehydrogenase
MQLAMIGLGRMGGNMAERLMRHGHEMVVFDRTAETVAKYEKLGATGTSDLAKMVQALRTPRVIWIMVPAGDPVDQTIATLTPMLSPGDIIIDGGNSNFHDTIRRGQQLAQSKIELIDSGTSGGIWGLENGYCLMVGGSEPAVKHCEPIFTALAPENGYAHVGPTGSGHYVKMVHNGIEYGLLQPTPRDMRSCMHRRFFRSSISSRSPRSGSTAASYDPGSTSSPPAHSRAMRRSAR